MFSFITTTPVLLSFDAPIAVCLRVMMNGIYPAFTRNTYVNADEPESPGTMPREGRPGFSSSQVALIVLLAMLVAGVATFFVARSWLFTSEFRPVELSAGEQTVLDDKLQRLGGAAAIASKRGEESDAEWLRAEPYSEAGADRVVSFSEREINGLIARDPKLANRLALDFSDDLASARALIPLDPEFPLLGGRTIRVNAGLELGFARGRPRVVLKGVSIMGVPIPNAWLGNLKSVDLVEEFGDAGFWQSFSKGVRELRVSEGELLVELAE
jgi:hypothetical protein